MSMNEWRSLWRKSINMSRICEGDIDYLRILINFALSILWIIVIVNI